MGKPSRVKGKARELQLERLFQSWGLEAYRIGGDRGKSADIDVMKIGRDAPFVGECKARKDGFKQLYAWLDNEGAEFLALKADRAEWLFVLPERVMRELLQQ